MGASLCKDHSQIHVCRDLLRVPGRTYRGGAQTPRPTEGPSPPLLPSVRFCGSDGDEEGTPGHIRQSTGSLALDLPRPPVWPDSHFTRCCAWRSHSRTLPSAAQNGTRSDAVRSGWGGVAVLSVPTPPELGRTPVTDDGKGRATRGSSHHRLITGDEEQLRVVVSASTQAQD
ncbi:hypothetical protein MG293_014279 [Ovis ammon polii]|uniref:Uncharacterized protein n=1 Tax=Ovis ammon polii TaxID=230172 RepID=A0AAD4TXC9_OVIAM|nr:hypothetical protein MG293_014279 [Ovis ammon polii]